MLDAGAGLEADGDAAGLSDVEGPGVALGLSLAIGVGVASGRRTPPVPSRKAFRKIAMNTATATIT
jgi:hypothetical protein